MRVAASSPAWFTRRADERKARCSAVRGFLPLEELVDDLEFGGGGTGLALGVVEGLWTCEELVSGEAGEEKKRAAHCRTCLVAARAGLVAGRSIMGCDSGLFGLACWRKTWDELVKCDVARTGGG